MISTKKILILFVFLACASAARADWTRRESGTLAWLRDVYFADERRGWIVGSGGTVLTTDDGGATWTKAKKFTEDNLRQIVFTDEQTGWILCERDRFALGSREPSYLLRTTNGGARWEPVEFTDGLRKRVAKIFFDETGAGFAVGESGAFYQLSNAGKTWKRAAPPSRYLLLDGVFSEGANGAVVGAGGALLFTNDAGATWSAASVFGAADGARLNRVFFINQRNGWTVGTGGAIYQTVNGGKIWRAQASGAAADLTDILFTDTANGWAIGDQGTILQTGTAGNVWTAVKSNAAHKLERIFFTGKKGFAVGFGGTILEYRENSAAGSSPHLKTRN